MKCLETRVRADGIRTRRYELTDGRRITTMELPATVVKAIGANQASKYMAIWQRGEIKRAQTHLRRQRVEELLRQGIKPTAVAHEVGITEERVRQIRKEMNLADKFGTQRVVNT